MADDFDLDEHASAAPPTVTVTISKTVQPQSLDNSGKEKLRQFVARIERLEADKAEVAADIKEVYGEAKAVGYDTKVLRQVIRIRKMDPNDRAEQESILDLYLHALGDA